ncbi:hypothetical protein [Limimaricola cinnabarinus]|uniref:hypothetical protein n=1 Tax=Limimaricola cinnabarinus TaxID=1125964 RepID=UPI002492112B|nr:hypothetical protein [Limimaricola cinnabarinus]
MRNDILSKIPGVVAATRVAALSAALLLPAAAGAQSYGFQLDNGLTLEQMTASRSVDFSAPTNRSGPTGSTISQTGNENRGFTGQIASKSAVAALFQAGERNLSGVNIVRSPNSAAALVQLGEENYGLINVIEGRNNLISAVQLGNRLALQVNLVSSQGTEMVVGQIGEGASGSITVRNAPSGTVIRLGD